MDNENVAHIHDILFSGENKITKLLGKWIELGGKYLDVT